MDEPDTHQTVTYEDLLVMAQFDRAERRPVAPMPVSESKSFLDTPDDYTDPRRLADLFKALGNEMRIEIIQLLEVQPARSADIAFTLEVRPNVLTRHLRILEKARIVTAESYGKSRIYSLKSGITPLLSTSSGMTKP